MTKLEQFKKQKKDLQAQITAEAKALFKEESAKLFQDHPYLKSFSWHQYSPYFSVSVYKDEPHINGDDEAWHEVIQIDWRNKTNPGFTPEMVEPYRAVKAFLNQFDEDMFKDLFGDHCEVTVTADGVEVEHHEHD